MTEGKRNAAVSFPAGTEAVQRRVVDAVSSVDSQTTFGWDLQRALEHLRCGIDVDRHFERLFRRYCRLVLSAFRRKGLSPDRSQDLAQETFLRVYRGIGEFRGEARFESWLLKIADNVYLHDLRKGAAGKRSGEEVPLDSQFDGGQIMKDLADPSASPKPLRHLLHQEEQQALQKAVEDLPPQMRRCVMLRLAHDLRYREIAEHLELSVGAVKVQLSRARKRLHRILGRRFR